MKVSLTVITGAISLLRNISNNDNIQDKCILGCDTAGW
jgi:hypothetical protein